MGVLGLAGYALVGCGDTVTSLAPTVTPATPAGPVVASTGGTGPTIGLVMKSLNNDFFKDMRDAALKYQQQKGTFKLITTGIQTETDIDEQATIVENLIKQKVDAIVIAPADSYGLVPVLTKAVKAGVKVVNIDVKLDDASMKKAEIDLVFVGPDNTVGAKLSGDVLAKTLGVGGKVALLEGNPGAANAVQRKNGFLAAIQEGGLILLESKTAHWEMEEARTLFINILTAHPEVQGVMCANDSMVLGVIKALETTGAGNKVQIAGFDNIPAVQLLVKEGKVLVTVDQYGSQQAIFGIDNALKLLAGEQVAGWIKTPVKAITKADL
jgi:ribose transport system substrate-binding protein